MIAIIKDVVDLKPLIDDVCKDDFLVLLITLELFDEIIGETDPDIVDASHQNGMSSSVVGITLATGDAAGVLMSGIVTGVVGAFVSCQPERPFDSQRPR